MNNKYIYQIKNNIIQTIKFLFNVKNNNVENFLNKNKIKLLKFEIIIK